MEDIPSAYSPTAKVLLEDQTHGLTPDTTTERLTRLAGFGWIFCLLNIAILLWLSVLLVMERGPEKLSMISLGISILNAIVAFIVSILWTVTILNLSRKIDHKSLATTTSSHIQIKVNFGPGSWLSWIVTCLLLMTVIPLLKIYVADRHAIAEEREVDRLVEAVLHPKEKELD